MTVKSHWLAHLIGIVLVMFTLQASWAADIEQASALVKETTDKMLAELKQQKDMLKSNPKQVYDLVDKIVLPNFDFESMSKLVLGKNWRGLSAAQQQAFVKEFRTLLVRTYATALIDVAVDEVKVEYDPLRAEADARRLTVKTHVTYGATTPMDIDYGMLSKNDTWKIYNVSVGGVSLVTNYRSEFADKIKSMGADKLIAEIAERNRKAEAGE